MENKNNGRGIFYGVIGVATLVVAIIGATFAFFTATVNTDNNAINVAAAEVKLELDDTQKVEVFKNNMIPVDVLDATGKANENFYYYPGNGSGNGAGTCTDDVGNSICSLYQIAVKNPAGSPAQTVEGSIQVTANEGFKNLHYAVFSGTIDGLETTHFNLQTRGETTTTVGGKTVYWGNGTFISGQATKGTTGSNQLIAHGVIGTGDGALTPGNEWSSWGAGSRVLLNANDTAVFTILLWLEDTGSVQNDEMNAVASLAVRFASAEGSQVTGTILATGPTQ